MYDAQGALCFITGPSMYNGEKKREYEKMPKSCMPETVSWKESLQDWAGSIQRFN